jgi:hypothetical protein
MKKLILLSALIFAFSNSFSQAKAPHTVELEHPTAGRINDLDKVFQGFVTAIKGPDIEKCKAYLSSMVLKVTSSTELKGLAEGIRDNNPLIVLSKKIEKDKNGYGYDMIEYRYKQDKDPIEILQITFDNENKILGIISNRPRN